MCYTSFMIRKLLYLTIVVKDQTRALEFYTDVLGFEKIADYQPEGGPRWLTISPKGQDIQMNLFLVGSYPPGTPQSRWQPGGDGPAWTLLSDDCRKDFEYLKSRGVRFLAEPTEYPWGVGATFSDPDGNTFSLLAPGSPGATGPAGEEQAQQGERETGAAEAPSGKPPASPEKVLQTFSEISGGWKKRSFLERQWVQRDFKKETGLSVDEMSQELASMVSSSKAGRSLKDSTATLMKLSSYYEHLSKLIPQFDKVPEKIKESLKATQSGIDEIQSVLSGLVMSGEWKPSESESRAWLEKQKTAQQVKY
jgi:catechol 2,3-dioxygenase-like lactoylglutathione lyase family enzyme